MRESDIHKKEIKRRLQAISFLGEYSAVTVLFALSFTLRFVGIQKYGLNSDELFSFLQAKGDLLSSLLKDIHPPLYLILVKPFTFLGPEISTRGVSALAGVVFCALVWHIAKRGYGPKIALVTLLFTSVSAPLIWLSTMGRSYSLFMAMAALALLAFTWLREKPNVHRMLILALFLAGALYTFYYAVFLFGFFTLVFIFTYKSDRAASKFGLGGVGLASVFCAPLVYLIIAQYQRVTEIMPWSLWEAGPYQLIRRIMQIFVQFSPAAPLSDIAYAYHSPLVGKIITLLLFILILFFGLIGAIRKNRSNPSTGLLIGLFFFTTIIAIALHWTAHLMIAHHYFAFLALVIFPITAAGCLLPRNLYLKLILIVLIVGANLFAIPAYKEKSVENLREAAELIDDKASDNAAIVTVAFFISDAYKVYGQRDIDVYGLPSDLPGQKPLTREADGLLEEKHRVSFEKIIEGRNEIFFIASHWKRADKDRGIQLSEKWLNQNGYILDGVWSTGPKTTVSRFVKAGQIP